MVTFITVLQVNLVMSILLYVMVLVYLYGIQAANMDAGRHGQQQQQQQQQQPSPDPLNALIIQLLQADLTRGKSRGNQSQQGRTRDPQETLLPLLLPDSLREEWGDESSVGLLDPLVPLLHSDLLRQQKRYNSPRVLLSERKPLQPPPLYLPDDFLGGGGGAQEASVTSNRTRRRRYAEHRSYRGEYSVCDSMSKWVTDRSQATDNLGNSVTVLAKIKTSATQEVKQYFYETVCREARPVKGGCRGIDDKNWNSQCKTTQTYVRALAQLGARTSWRWIRINTSCVCALSKKRHRT